MSLLSKVIKGLSPSFVQDVRVLKSTLAFAIFNTVEAEDKVEEIGAAEGDGWDMGYVRLAKGEEAPVEAEGKGEEVRVEAEGEGEGWDMGYIRLAKGEGASKVKVRVEVKVEVKVKDAGCDLGYVRLAKGEEVQVEAEGKVEEVGVAGGDGWDMGYVRLAKGEWLQR